MFFLVFAYRCSESCSFTENSIVFIKQSIEVYFSPLYCVFADGKSDSIILHVSYAREKQPRRRETRGVKYFQLKLYL